MFFCPPPFMKTGNPTLLLALQRLGLTSNLRLCLDAGDAASYSSGQSWLDRSGNGYDFFRGATGSASTDDPTFNGTSGGLSASEYWSFDGGDFFRYDSTNETWMQNIHKDNAKFTFIGWTYIGTLGATATLVGTQSTGGGTGFQLVKPAVDTIRLNVTNAGSTVLQQESSNTFNANAWNFHAITVDETAGTGSAVLNGTVTNFTSTYASPAAGNATATMEIAARGGGNNLIPSGSRMAMVAAWEGLAVSSADLVSIFNATRTRFGV